MNKFDVIENKLNSLSKSKFRNSFKLSDKDRNYIIDKGMNKIIEHAYGFINERLASDKILNDGKQTPMKGHPVFVAQHATATCCRGCLYKWHNISKNRKLTDNEVNYIVSVIVVWIEREIKNVKYK